AADRAGRVGGRRRVAGPDVQHGVVPQGGFLEAIRVAVVAGGGGPFARGAGAPPRGGGCGNGGGRRAAVGRAPLWGGRPGGGRGRMGVVGPRCLPIYPPGGNRPEG